MSGVLFSIFAAVFGGMQIVYQKKSMQKISSGGLQVVILGISFFVLALPLILIFEKPTPQIIFIIFLKDFLMAVSYLLFAEGVKNLPVSYSSITKNLTPMFAYITGLAIGFEKFSFFALIGVFWFCLAELS